MPLGLFQFEDPGDDKVKITKQDFSGRRYLFGPLHPYTLTHISNVNWMHGGQTSITRLREHYRKGREEDEKANEAEPYRSHHHHHHHYMRFTFTFDDALCDKLPRFDPDDEIKFYRRIISVRYETAEGVLKRVPEWGDAHLSKCRRKLHYDIPLDCLEAWLHRTYGSIFHVTLNCDFLPDRKGSRGGWKPPAWGSGTRWWQDRGRRRGRGLRELVSTDRRGERWEARNNRLMAILSFWRWSVPGFSPASC